MLRLLNAADPHTRFFSYKQHLLMCKAWCALSAVGIGCYDDDPSQTKMGEATDVKYITQASVRSS